MQPCEHDCVIETKYGLRCKYCKKKFKMDINAFMLNYWMGMREEIINGEE